MKLSPVPFTNTPDFPAKVAGAVNQLIKGTKNVLPVSADHTATLGEDVILGDATGAAITVTLPSANQYSGLQFIIKKVDASANAVTIDGDGADIDGAATVAMTTQYESRTIVSDGTDWAVI